MAREPLTTREVLERTALRHRTLLTPRELETVRKDHAEAVSARRGGLVRRAQWSRPRTLDQR
jgi:hypothetical protein